MALHLLDLLQAMGQPGRYQILVYVLLFLNYMPVVFNHLSMAFYGAGAIKNCESGDVNITSNINASTSFWGDGNGTANSDDEGMHYKLDPGEWTIVAEWNLTCERAYMARLSTTVYFIGVLTGGLIVGTIADRFGRRLVMLVSLYCPIVVGVAIALSTNYIMFTSLRFVQGLLMQALQTTSYVLIMEMSLPKYRTHAGTVTEVFWGLSVITLGILAYLIRNWRYIQWAITVPAVLAVSYIWLIPESLCWLFHNEKIKEARHHVTKLTKANKLPFPEETFENVKTRFKEYLQKNENHRKYTILDTIKTPLLRKRSLALFYIWFSTAIGYYGISLSITDMAGDKYINFLIGASVELVAYAISIFILNRFGRRKPVFVYFFIGGVACISAGAIPKETGGGTDLRFVKTGLALFGRFNMAGLFSVIFLYGSELYPTVIRSIGSGMCAVFLRLGGVLAPQILILGQYTSASAPIILFGVIALIGSVVTLVLPETNHKKLPETIEELEDVCTSDADLQESHIKLNSLSPNGNVL